MSSSVALDLHFSQPFASPPSKKHTADLPPLFLAADGVHGFVNVGYSAACPASHSDDFIKLCLYGILIKPSVNTGCYLQDARQIPHQNRWGKDCRWDSKDFSGPMFGMYNCQ